MGIHDHDSKKLGRRPEDKSKPKLAFAHHLKALPEHPVVDPKVEGVEYPMDRNNEAGDCVVAGFHHACQAIFAAYGINFDGFTDDQILEMYQTQNPDFKSWSDAGTDADQGMIVAQFLSYMVKNGERYGLEGDKKFLGFAKINNKDPDEYKAGVYLGVCVLNGENLQIAQQEGLVWDFVPDSDDWGGHCTAGDGYDPTQYPTITWGEDDYVMTQAFVTHRMDEAYFLLFQCMVDKPGLRNGFDLYSFAQAYQAVTGRQFPVYVAPPGPNPVPGPTPFEGGRIEVSKEIINHITKTADHKKMTVQEWVDHHFTKYFNTK